MLTEQFSEVAHCAPHAVSSYPRSPACKDQWRDLDEFPDRTVGAVVPPGSCTTTCPPEIFAAFRPSNYFFNRAFSSLSQFSVTTTVDQAAPARCSRAMMNRPSEATSHGV
jgi:hypothetical protein